MTQEHAVLMVAIFAAPGILAFYLDRLKRALRESNIGPRRGASVAHQIPRGTERSREFPTDPDRSRHDGESETRSD